MAMHTSLHAKHSILLYMTFDLLFMEIVFNAVREVNLLCIIKSAWHFLLCMELRYSCGWIACSCDTGYYVEIGSRCWLATVVYHDALLQKLLQ